MQVKKRYAIDSTKKRHLGGEELSECIMSQTVALCKKLAASQNEHGRSVLEEVGIGSTLNIQLIAGYSRDRSNTPFPYSCTTHMHCGGVSMRSNHSVR